MDRRRSARIFDVSVLLTLALITFTSELRWLAWKVTAVTWFEWVGFIAFLGNVWGNIQLAKKDIKGWVVRIAVNVLWIIYAMHTEGGWPMWMNHITFFGINIYGWWEWSGYANGRSAERT